MSTDRNPYNAPEARLADSIPEAVPIETHRPLFVWILYCLHLCLIPWAVWYVASVFNLIPVDERLASALAQHSWRTKLSSVLVCGAQVAGVHRLFFRQPRAVAIYVVGPGIYVLQNILIFGQYCFHYTCPPSTFFVPVGTNAAAMLIMAGLISLAVKRWPPLATPSRAA